MTFVGIDISKDKIDVYFRPINKHFIFENNENGFKKLIKKLKNVELICLESTGKLERELVFNLVNSGYKVACVNPKHIRNFAKAGGKLSKTDKVDASVIAHYAQVYNPSPISLPSEEEEYLHELNNRRNQLIAQRVSENNRLLTAISKIKNSIKSHINWLNKEIKNIEQELKIKIKSNSEFNEKKEILESVPGVGEVLSTTLILELPELGKYSSKQISCLVGLAPVNRDSGNFRGLRKIHGGRKKVRSSLFMPCLAAIRCNNVIKDFHQRLIAKGKPNKVAVTACMHKLLIILNAMIKNGTKWDSSYKEIKSIEKLPIFA